MSALYTAAGRVNLTAAQSVGLASAFWQWYDDHKRDVIVKKKILIFSVTILVKDLRPLFEMLFGPDPIWFSRAGGQ